MSDSAFDQLTWLKTDENPFGLICLDCRSFTGTMLSTTQDPGVAKRFIELRATPGDEYRSMPLLDSTNVTSSLEYPMDAMLKDGPLFKASEMEEKWDVYLYDHVLYFSRSWTGDLIFKANIHMSNQHMIVDRIEINKMVNATDAAFIIRQIDFLIRSHIFQQVVPHPLPADLPNDKQTIALYSFSQYGRRASFATFEDTLRTTK